MSGHRDHLPSELNDDDKASEDTDSAVISSKVVKSVAKLVKKGDTQIPPKRKK